MRDKVMAFIKEHKLWLVFFVAALIKQLLVIGLPIYVVPGSPCDDELMKDWAFSIAGFNWLGDFGAYTFMKEPGFAIFLAVCFRLHLPYIFMLTLGYSVACIIFSSALKNIFSSKKYVAIIYLILLFHPISFCSTVLQRVYRNGLGVILTLCIFGGLLHMYFSVGREKQRPLLLWSAFTGLSLGYLWITKSDTIWILPFTGTVCLVMFFILLAKHRNLKSLPRYLCLSFPFLGIFLCSYGIKTCDMLWYGTSSLEYYGVVMEDLTHIRSGQGNEKIQLTRKQLRELYQLSPTLAGVQEELEREMDAHNSYDTNPEDGEVEAGWLGWALLRGLSDAGVYDSSEKAIVFYQNVYNELEAAFTDGRLERIETGTAQKYYMDTPAHCRELAGRVRQVIEHMVDLKGTRAKALARKSQECDSQGFEQLTREKTAYYGQRHDYYSAGWIVFPEYEWQDLNVYVEDKEGKQYKELEFQNSADIYAYLKGKGTVLEGAKKCRFKAGWDVENDKADASWYLAVYENGRKAARIQVGEEGFRGDGNIEFIGILDTYSSKRTEQNVGKASRAAATRLNFIRFMYCAGGKVVFWLGLISYGVLTVVVIRNLRRKKFEYGNAWLVATGLGLSSLVFAAGIALVDLTQCLAINTMYLSSSYVILMSAELISLCKCVELAIGFVCGRELIPSLRWDGN